MQLSLQGIHKSYGEKKILNGINADIEPGSLLSITGVNGAGKTTILNILTGICGLDQGEVLFENQAFHRDNVEQRKKLYYLSDNKDLFMKKNILENIAIRLKLWDVDTSPESKINDKVMLWLEEFDLIEHANSHLGTLSRGQYYKASLICLLAVDPELWLIDEPFASGMDPQGISMFKKYAKAATERGNTVIYTTQLLDLAEKFSNQIWVLDDQELKINCTTDQLSELGNLESLFSKLRDKEDSSTSSK